MVLKLEILSFFGKESWICQFIIYLFYFYQILFIILSKSSRTNFSNIIFYKTWNWKKRVNYSNKVPMFRVLDLFAGWCFVIKILIQVQIQDILGTLRMEISKYALLIIPSSGRPSTNVLDPIIIFFQNFHTLEFWKTIPQIWKIFQFTIMKGEFLKESSWRVCLECQLQIQTYMSHAKFLIEDST